MSNSVKSSMYALRPVFKLPEQMELPKNMYTLRKVQAVGEPTLLHGIQEKVKNILKSSVGNSVELERRWDLVLEQLLELKQQLADIKKSVEHIPSKSTVGNSNSVVNSNKTPDVINPNILQQLLALDGAVVNASPSEPPYSLLALRRLLAPEVSLKLSCHTHSSTPAVDPAISSLFSTPAVDPASVSPLVTLTIIIIWRQGVLDAQLVTLPHKHASILGEVNIVRHFARLGAPRLQYDDKDLNSLLTDQILDTCHRLVHVRTAKEKQAITRNLNAKLGKSVYFGGDQESITDVAAWASLKRAQIEDLPANLAKWFQRVFL